MCLNFARIFISGLISGFFNNRQKCKIKRSAKLPVSTHKVHQLVRCSFGLKKEMPKSFLYLNSHSHHMLFLKILHFWNFLQLYISLGDKKKLLQNAPSMAGGYP